MCSMQLICRRQVATRLCKFRHGVALKYKHTLSNMQKNSYINSKLYMIVILLNVNTKAYLPILAINKSIQTREVMCI